MKNLSQDTTVLKYVELEEIHTVLPLQQYDTDVLVYKIIMYFFFLVWFAFYSRKRTS